MKKQYAVLGLTEGSDFDSLLPLCYGGLKYVLDTFKYRHQEFVEQKDQKVNLVSFWLVRLDNEFTPETPLRFFFKYATQKEDAEGRMQYKGTKPFVSYVDKKAPMRNFGILEEYL